jgi:hypothetical protein
VEPPRRLALSRRWRGSLDPGDPPVIRLGHTAIPEPPQIQGGAAKQLPRPLIQGGGSPRRRHEDQLPNSGDRGPSARRGHEAPAESGWPGPAPDPDTSPPGPQPPT